MLDRLRLLFTKQKTSGETAEEKYESLFDKAFNADIIRFEAGSDIAEYGDEICQKIEDFRNGIAERTSFIFPLVRILQNNDLQENEIKVFVREKEVCHDFLIPNLEKILEATDEKLDYIYCNYLEDIFTNEFFEKIINKVQLDNAWLVWNLSCRYSVFDMKEVLINLLKLKKSIKNINYIFEKMGKLPSGVSCNVISNIIASEI